MRRLICPLPFIQDLLPISAHETQRFLHRRQHEKPKFDTLPMALSFGDIGTLHDDTPLGFSNLAFGLQEVGDCSVEAHKRLPAV